MKMRKLAIKKALKLAFFCPGPATKQGTLTCSDKDPSSTSLKTLFTTNIYKNCLFKNDILIHLPFAYTCVNFD